MKDYLTLMLHLLPFLIMVPQFLTFVYSFFVRFPGLIFFFHCELETENQNKNVTTIELGLS